MNTTKLNQCVIIRYYTITKLLQKYLTPTLNGKPSSCIDNASNKLSARKHQRPNIKKPWMTKQLFTLTKERTKLQKISKMHSMVNYKNHRGNLEIFVTNLALDGRSTTDTINIIMQGCSNYVPWAKFGPLAIFVWPTSTCS